MYAKHDETHLEADVDLYHGGGPGGRMHVCMQVAVHRRDDRSVEVAFLTMTYPEARALGERLLACAAQEWTANELADARKEGGA